MEFCENQPKAKSYNSLGMKKERKSHSYRDNSKDH